MGKGTFLSNPLSDSCSIAGGSWQASLPLANLKTQQPTEVARSTSAATGTGFIVDAGVTRNWQAFAWINHNLTSAGQFRVTLSNTSDFAVTTGITPFIPARPAVSANPDRPWDGFDEDATPGGVSAFYVHPTVLSGRYLLISNLDTTNPDGYIQIGRFMAGMPFIPGFNFTYGATTRIIDPSTVSESVGGQEWWDKRPKRRAMSISYDALSEDAAFGPLYDMQTKLGLTGNLVFCQDPDETAAMKPRRTMYCRFESLEPIVEANPSVSAPFTASLSLLELL